jgi:hypothetical protein
MPQCIDLFDSTYSRKLRVICALLVAFARLGAAAMAQDRPTAVISPSSVSSETYIAHVTVIDTKTGKEIRDETVIISGNRISAVKRSNEIELQAGVKVVDGKGKYLIPALWDMHVHAVFAERLDTMFPMFIANGILGIRDMGTSMPLAPVAQLRKELLNGSRIGPRIVVAGPIFDGRR